MIDESRWQSDEYVNDLAGDPQTLPQVLHYLTEAVFERDDCTPEDRAEYDALVLRLAKGAVAGLKLYATSAYFSPSGEKLEFPRLDALVRRGES